MKLFLCLILQLKQLQKEINIQTKIIKTIASWVLKFVKKINNKKTYTLKINQA